MTHLATPVWDDAGYPDLPRLEGDVQADVCVVGLGGSGLAAVHELLAEGVRVAAVDAGPVGGGAGGRNGGFLLAGMAPFYHDAVARYGRERARSLYLATLAELDRMADETPDAIRRTGSLRIADTPGEEDDCRVQREAMRADGLPVLPYEGPEGRGLLIPSDAAFHPLLRCRTLAERAAGRGALLFQRSPAVSISGDAVETPEGRVACGAVVVAVDGALPRVLPELAAEVRTARLQMLATAPTHEVHVPRPVYSRWGYEYWQQLPDGRVTLGGFRDAGGDEEWTESTEPSGRVQLALERFLRERVGVHTQITHRWAASVGFTRSALPVLREVRPRVWAAGGYSGTGNVVGALCGRAAARRALARDSDWADLLP